MFLRCVRLIIVPIPVAQLILFKSSDAILVCFRLNVILSNDTNPNSVLYYIFKSCRLKYSPNTPFSTSRNLQCNISRYLNSVKAAKDDRLCALNLFHELFVCFLKLSVSSYSRMFYLFGDVPIADEGLQNLTHNH